MKCKILSVILCVMIMCQTAVLADTKRAVIDKSELDYSVGVMNTLDILEYSKSNSGDIISRIDFAVYFARLLKVDESAKENKTYFSDIKIDHYALTSVNYLVSIGAIDGVGETMFNPNNSIKAIDAAKMIFCALGYKTYAQMTGDYPIAYQNLARKTNLLEGFDYNQDITREELAVILMRAGLISKYSLTGIDGDKIELSEAGGHTIFSDYWDIEEYEGIVSQYDRVRINDKTDRKKGWVTIGDKTAIIGAQQKADIIGCNVRAIVQETDAGDVMLGAEVIDTDVLELSYSDISEYEDFTIYWIDGNEKIKKSKIASDANIIYNGEILKYGIDECFDLDNIDKGRVRLIDINDDSRADTVIIENYKSYVVGASENEKLFKNDGSGLVIDLDNYEYGAVYDLGGNEKKISDIKSGAVVSVIENGDYADVYYSGAAINGTLEASYDEYGRLVFVIDGFEYTVDKSFRKNNTVWFNNGTFTGTIGTTLNFRLDRFNEIVYIDSAATDTIQPAYVIKMYYDEAFGDDGEEKVCLKLLTKNGEICKYFLSKNVKIDGEKIRGAKTANDVLEAGDCEVILFKLNNNDEINYIDTVTKIDGSNTLRPSASEKKIRTWSVYNYSYDNDIMLGKSTVIFRVPAKTEGSSDRDYTIGSYTGYLSGHRRWTKSYKINEENFIDDIVVEYNMDNTSDFTRAKMLLIDEVNKRVENDEIKYIIEGYLGGTAVTYSVSEDCMENHFTNKANSNSIQRLEQLGSGDCVRVILNDYGEISEMDFMVDYSDGLEVVPKWAPATTNYSSYNISRLYCMKKTKDGLYMATEARKDAPIAVRCNFVYGTPTVTVYDSSKSNDKIRKGSLEDIDTFEVKGGSLNPVFMLSLNYYAQDIIVYK